MTKFPASAIPPEECNAVLGAWYTFDESSGSTRSDSHGIYDLDDTNSNVPQGTGIVLGSSASFDRTTEPNLELLYSEGSPATTSLMTATDVCGCAWVVFNNVSYPHYIMRRGQADTVVYNNNGFEWTLGCAVSGGSYYLQIAVYPMNSVVRATNDPVSIGTPYFVYWWHKSSTDETGISVNGGTPVLWPTTRPDPTLRATLGDLLVGRLIANADSYYDNFRFDGRVDNAGLWYGDKLTDEMVAFLYNSGSGRTYAEWVAAYPDN